ncbi:MAG: hypothetical protein HYR55_01090 [Acidobacteria bacterium]|nr:hypothetical protein [Acidobacteriota bacterium]MBI3655615.1 hypothetical protein [Acidobacteriota bacterium]
MKNFWKAVPESLRRLVLVFAVLAGGFVSIRFMLPPSLKDNALHVKTTVAREMVKTVKYAGSDVCADCHDQYQVKKNGYHRNLSCETCHGAAKGHTDDPIEVKPTLPKLREFCVRCHAFNPSRPTGFPQISSAAHNPMKPCVSCHNPHDPKPPQVPQECQACHAEIARTKAVSPHVALECKTCHSVPDEHKVTPRAVKASIPSVREFCAKCHGKDSPVKETPKVDLATHGEKYLCWQCHYPHMPEVK